MAFWAKLLFKQFLQCIRHKYVVLYWHICLFISSFLFSSDTQVVMVSIGNTYHYSWNIYGQSTVGRIFLDSIVNRSYSVFLLLLIILFSFIFFHILMEKRLGYEKQWKCIKTLKDPLFWFLKAFVLALKIHFYKIDWLVSLFLFGFRISELFCLKLWF